MRGSAYAMLTIEAKGHLLRSNTKSSIECLDLYKALPISWNFGGEVAFRPTDGVKPGSMTVQGLGVDIY